MFKEMIRCFAYWPVAAMFLFAATSPLFAADQPPVKGGALPAFELPVPQDLQLREYLGLSESGSFTIREIKAQVVIIEIFSMYCPFCQQEAPRVNELFNLIVNQKVIQFLFQ